MTALLQLRTPRGEPEPTCAVSNFVPIVASAADAIGAFARNTNRNENLNKNAAARAAPLQFWLPPEPFAFRRFRALLLLARDSRVGSPLDSRDHSPKGSESKDAGLTPGPRIGGKTVRRSLTIWLRPMASDLPPPTESNRRWPHPRLAPAAAA